MGRWGGGTGHCDPHCRPLSSTPLVISTFGHVVAPRQGFSSLQGLVRRKGLPGGLAASGGRQPPPDTDVASVRRPGRGSGRWGWHWQLGLICISPSVYLEDLIKAGFLQEIDALIFCVVSREAEFYFLSNI